MKLEEGMYVRTKWGIFKIRKITKDLAYWKHEKRVIELDRIIPEYNYRFSFYKDESIFKGAKFKDNIIDLIEVGDIITFNFSDDVYKVLCVPNKKVGCEDFYFEFDLSQELEDVRIKPEIVKEQIKSIVTKEQFESAEYKVERG